MSNVFIGQIIHGGWNYAPRGFALCAGQQQSIAQNSALFALLGTSFGGNGTTTFNLPDLRGRAAVNTGQGPGLSNYALGQQQGAETTTLTQNNLPQHTHPATFASTSSLNALTAKATQQEAGASAASMLARSVDTAANPVSAPAIYGPTATTGTTTVGGLNVAGTVTVGPAGGSLPLSLIQPVLAVTVVIALQGIFPSRN